MTTVAEVSPAVAANDLVVIKQQLAEYEVKLALLSQRVDELTAKKKTKAPTVGAADSKKKTTKADDAKESKTAVPNITKYFQMNYDKYAASFGPKLKAHLAEASNKDAVKKKSEEDRKQTLGHHGWRFIIPNKELPEIKALYTQVLADHAAFKQAAVTVPTVPGSGPVAGVVVTPVSSSDIAEQLTPEAEV